MTTLTIHGSAPTNSQRYATVADLKVRLAIETTDTSHDTDIGDALDAVSRQIDDHCHRFFYQATATTMYYTAADSRELTVDDLVSVTTLATDDNESRLWGTTWATTDYDLEPYNAALTGRPYTVIRVPPAGTKEFTPGSLKAVKIVGTFGWPSVPGRIEQACLLQAQRLYMRRHTPLGIYQNYNMSVWKIDPDVEELLADFVKEAPRATISWEWERGY